MTSVPAIQHEVVPYNSSVPSPHEIAVFESMAHQAVTSKMYRNIGDQSGVFMIMLAAREMGIPPMAALNGGINIIQGKVEISARMMSAMIRRAGHSMQVIENTDTICTIKGTRRDNGDTLTTSYTIVDAQKAGLVRSGGGWTKFPKDMCFARAMSRLARQLFSDVIGMGYIEGEISDAQQPLNVRPLPALSPESPKVVDIQVLQDIQDQYDEWVVKTIPEEEWTQFNHYFKAVQDNFSWSTDTTMRELLNNKEHTLESFNKWKNKKKD